MSDSLDLYNVDYDFNQYSSEFHEYATKKKAKGKARAAKNQTAGMQLRRIDPMTQSQNEVFHGYNSGLNMMLHGCAGTGKTFISSYLAIRDVMEKVDGKKSVHIVRSVVPTRDIGFLPGSEKEKTKVYEQPYYSIFSELFGRGDAYEVLKSKHMVNFTTTSFIRGLTIDNSIVIVDECQNLNFHELDSVITRLGHNCKVIFCGDFLQSDFDKNKERQGILDFMRIIGSMESFGFVEFDRDDIVRSDLVKQYICMKMDMGYH
jgi:phosphate starvation-inducible PhoH-like protein